MSSFMTPSRIHMKAGGDKISISSIFIEIIQYKNIVIILKNVVYIEYICTVRFRKRKQYGNVVLGRSLVRFRAVPSSSDDGAVAQR